MQEESIDKLYVRHESSSSGSGSGSTTPTEKVLSVENSPHAHNVVAQSAFMDQAGIALEYGVAAHTKYLYLGLYFALNLIITLYNKAVLGKVRSCMCWFEDYVCRSYLQAICLVCLSMAPHSAPYQLHLPGVLCLAVAWLLQNHRAHD